MLGAIEAEDAVAMPLLAEPACLRLLEEASRLEYRTAREVVGEGDARVWQRMEVQPSIPAESGFHRLAAAFQALWDRALADVDPYPFESRLVYNDLMLQRYDVGETGITPHRDHVEYRNLICLIVLAGRGRFCLCDDRRGAGMREIPHGPGDVIVTRAPGFLGSSRRPFHCVGDVTEPRYVFGLRQDRRRGFS